MLNLFCYSVKSSFLTRLWSNPNPPFLKSLYTEPILQKKIREWDSARMSSLDCPGKEKSIDCSIKIFIDPETEVESRLSLNSFSDSESN